MRIERRSNDGISRMPARSKMLLAAALAASGVAHEARADSAVGTNPASGTQLNPNGQFPGLTTTRLSNFWDQSRSPTGLLYPKPPLFPEMVQSTSDPDWWSSGWAEAGYIGTAGKTGAAAFREYGDWATGPIISNAGFLAENRKTANYVSVNVGNVARDDQYYQLNFGKYGLFNATLSYDSIPHVFSTDSKVLWDGAGTGELILPSSLKPGASTVAQVQAAFSSTAPSEVSLKREKAGFSASYMPFDDYELFFRLSNEWREGTRGFGATFGMPNQAGATELVEPIDYRTLEISSGLRFKGEQLQANITYSGSFFTNEIATLVWENPGLSNLAASAFRPTRGRMALTPSNSYNTLKGDVAWAFTPKARFTASIAGATMRQNEDLIPPTVSTGIINGVATSINLGNWNTVNALSQKTAKAAIDTYNLFAQLQVNPMPAFRLDLEVRGRGEDNNTNYLAFNPLTGQYGYIALDGGLAPNNARLSGVYEPNVTGSLVQIRNIPFAKDTLDFTGRAAYQLANRDKVQLTLTRRAIHNDRREVVNSVDNRLSAQFSSRGHEWGTFRLTYEFASLDGDDYVSYPYGQYDSFSLPGYRQRFPTGDAPFTLDEMRKFDVADRIEHVFKAQTNYVVSEKVDFQLTGDFKSDRYGADYGVRKAEIFDLNAELNYQLSLSTTVNAYYSYQGRYRNDANIRSGTLIASGAAGSSSYPLANAWMEAADDRSHVFGVGAHHKIDNVTIDVSYTYLHSKGAIGYTYASLAAISNQLTAAQAGNAFPDTTFDDQVLETGVLWNYTAKLAVRGYYRLEYEKLEDLHYAGLTNVIRNNIYLGAIPQNYTAHIIGIFFQYSY